MLFLLITISLLSLDAGLADPVGGGEGDQGAVALRGKMTAAAMVCDCRVFLFL